MLLHRVMGLRELVLLRERFSDCELAALRLLRLLLVLLKVWPRNSVRSFDCGLGPSDLDCGLGPSDLDFELGPSDLDCGRGPSDLDCGLGPSMLLWALEVRGERGEERTDSVDRKREMVLSWAFLRIISRNSSLDSFPSPFWSFLRNTAST